MNLVVKADSHAVADHAAGVVIALVTAKPDAAIAVPTGKTPLLLYERLGALVRSGDLDLDRVHWFALDEFVGDGIPATSTFAFFLEQRLVRPAGLRAEMLHVLDGAAEDLDGEARRYEALIAAQGGLDLTILGLGRNGHIGFNEPGTAPDSRTGIRHLTDATRQANAYLFPDAEVPRTALSMGIGTLLDARKVMLLATGEVKAEIVGRLATASPNPGLPASALVTHPDCCIVVDEDAAAMR
jgi:glucosamine-6-phosphate deaminase